MRGLSILLLLVSGCYEPRDLSADFFVRLNAIHPELAAAGQTIWLEGSFGAAAVVHFSGASTPAVPDGAGRIKVTVPSGASSGVVTVETGGLTTNGLPFRVAQSMPSLGGFSIDMNDIGISLNGDETGLSHDGRVFLFGGYVSPYSAVRTIVSAAIEPTRIGLFATEISLLNAHDLGSAVATEAGAYLIGGSDKKTDFVTFAANGHASEVVDGPALNDARYGATAVVIGPWVYVAGCGKGQISDATDSIERARIGKDGKLGPFEIAGHFERVLKEPAIAVVGRYLYVLGGVDGNVVSAIERAEIAGDGSLAAFEPISNVALHAARARARAASIGEYLYVFGGSDGAANPVPSVERAMVANDNLQAFETFPLEAGHDHAPALMAGDRYCLVGGGNGNSAPKLECAAMLGL